MTESLRSHRWSVIAPVTLLVLAAVLFVAFDLTQGGEASPKPPLGAIGTPVRNAYVAPTVTPIGAVATPRPKATPTGSLKGTPAERDARRRTDLLLLVGAASKVKATSGVYPTTGGNVQTICAFKSVDVGCGFKDALGTEVPVDPTGDPVKNGYWYQSDGQTAKLYAAVEEELPAEQKCPTTDTELKKKLNLICIKVP